MSDKNFYRRNLLIETTFALFLVAAYLVFVCFAPATTNAGTTDSKAAKSDSTTEPDKSTFPFPRSLSTTSKMSKLSTTYNELTEKEAAVLIGKGTEMPWVGELTDNKLKGTYICRRCNSPLYKSDSKFDSHCGWPSFDDEIKGAVSRHQDADGSGRTEIVCKHCEGHLGHVFLGEGKTAKNTRHCVNSISMRFVEEGKKLPDVVRPEAKGDKEKKTEIEIKEVKKP